MKKDAQKNEIIIYEGDNGQLKIEVHIEGETAWLSQTQIAELFGVQRPAITKHLQKIFESGELDESLVSSILEHTTKHGAIEGKTQIQETKYYNLDLIISLGYRVKSQVATKFRIWATGIIKVRLLDKVPIEDLEYELSLLLGAAKICKLNEQNKGQDIGNTINYFKDSAYIHVRNLYNFFAANTSNDAKVTQFTDQTFDVSLYTTTWKDALHTHVLHIKTSRNKPNNVKNGVHLNQMIPKFAEDIERLWQEWIDATEDILFKDILNRTLKKAKENAQNDYENVQKC